MSENLNKIFDVDTKKPEIIVVKPSTEGTLMKAEESPEEVDIVLSDNLKMDLDVDNVRVVQYDLIEKGKESLESLIQFAKDSESPRAWEVVATLLKTTSDVANSLGELTMKKIKVKADTTPKKSGTGDTTVTNNTVFVGDTATLQKMLRGENTDEII